MEILRDPLWQFLGFFVAFLALAIALLQRPRKSLWWENYHFAPLFIEKGLAPEASVEIAGRTFIVLDLQEIVVEVFNRGNIAIEATHYERPLMFEFGEKAKIVAAEMLYEEPPGIGTRWCWGYNWISLVPAALNAGDLLEIRFLVFRARYVRMDGRIVGVKQIRQGSVELRTAALLVLGLVESLLLVPSVYLPLFVPEGLFWVARAMAAAATVLAGIGLWFASRELRRAKRRLRHFRAAQDQSFHEMKLQTSSLAKVKEATETKRSWWRRWFSG